MTLVAIRFHFDFIVANMLIHIVAIGLFFLLQLARGKLHFGFFIGAQPAHSYNCAQIYIVVITLVVLLQLAHDTSGNSVHFDFYRHKYANTRSSNWFILFVATGPCTCCNLVFTLEVIVVGKTELN
jgi:hypothetical protein